MRSTARVFIALGTLLSGCSLRAPAPSSRLAADESVAAKPPIASPDRSPAAFRTAGGSEEQPPSLKFVEVRDSTAGAALLIRTGNLSIRVDSLDPAIRKVGELIVSLGGYLTNSSIQTGDGQRKSATLEAKVGPVTTRPLGVSTGSEGSSRLQPAPKMSARSTWT